MSTSSTPDLESLRSELTAADFDAERHASAILQRSGEDVQAYLRRLTTAEEELDRRLQEQVRVVFVIRELYLPY